MYKIHGALASPYSMKLRAVLRYRRLPHIWSYGAPTNEAIRQVKAPVIPVLEFPDGSFANDTTPLLYELEERHRERSIIPHDPAAAFIAHLIEDFADEWLTKAMFGYRWLEEVDQIQMSEWLAFDAEGGGGSESIKAYAEAFRARQVGRMPLVGCTHENFQLIERSTKRVLEALERHVMEQRWIFGTRPSLAEFGLYGQLSQLGVDPTAQAMMRDEFPFTFRWLLHVDDASGVEGHWTTEDLSQNKVVIALLEEIGIVYGPFLLANEAAAKAGEDRFRVEIEGCPFSQGTFKYQLKCLQDLRARYEALDGPSKRSLSGMLDGTHCSKFLL